MFICPDHKDYEVPLLPTLAFGDGIKYWCPCCGKIKETDTSVTETEELKDRSEKYRNYVKDYIYAVGMPHWQFVIWNKKRIDPKDLPKEEKERLKKVVKDWKFGVKL